MLRTYECNLIESFARNCSCIVCCFSWNSSVWVFFCCCCGEGCFGWFFFLFLEVWLTLKFWERSFRKILSSQKGKKAVVMFLICVPCSHSWERCLQHSKHKEKMCMLLASVTCKSWGEGRTKWGKKDTWFPFHSRNTFQWSYFYILQNHTEVLRNLK